MDDLSAADVDPHVSRVAEDVSGLGFRKRSYGIALFSVSRRGMGKADAKVFVDTHDETGAVRAVRQAGAAVHVRISNELQCVIRHLLARFGASGGCHRLDTLPAGGHSRFGLFVVVHQRLSAGPLLCGCRCLSRGFPVGGFLLQTLLFLCLGFRLHELCREHHIVPGDIAVAFLDIHLDPAFQLLLNDQFILDRHHPNDRRVGSRLFPYE